MRTHHIATHQPHQLHLQTARMPIRARSMLSSAGGGGDGRLLAENAELSERLRRLAPALSAMARDLGHTRRENANLKRENLQLRELLRESAARLESTRGDARTTLSGFQERPRRT